MLIKFEYKLRITDWRSLER